jgi:dipeptidyl aminopeptidase/acylaminoacyl peptidase
MNRKLIRHFTSLVIFPVMLLGYISQAQAYSSHIRSFVKNGPKTVFSNIGLTQSSDSTRFALKKIFDLQWASNPRISPDGKRIVFIRNSYDIQTDGERHSLWIINSDGSGLRPITDPEVNAGSPRWSPSGDRLLYVAPGKEHGADILVRWMDSGQTARLATLEHGPGELTWSPKGDMIAFSMFVPSKQDISFNVPNPPKGADWGPQIKVIDQLVYRFNGKGYLPHGYTHLFVIPAEGGTPHQITSGNVNDGGSLIWARDGMNIIFSANRHEDASYEPLNSDIYEVPSEGGTIKTLTDRNGPDTNPVISPDGSLIAYTGFDDRYQGYQVTKLYLMDRNGGNKHVLSSSYDRSIHNPQWDRNGKGLYFQYDDKGVTKIGYITLRGKVSELTQNVGGLSIGRPYAGGQYTLSSKTGTIAYTLTASDHPADIAVFSMDSKKTKRLTNLNASLFDHLTLGSLEEINFKSSYDQRDIEGWLLKPPGFDSSKKYPLILEIHGGPFTNYGPRFSAEDQLYAAAGYVVLYINPRGSTSYGEEFGNLIHHDYPNHDYEDLMSGVDEVLKHNYIDPDQLFVTCGSGGGVLTAWIVGHTNRFKAAVVAKPVINWYSWVLTSDLPSYGIKYWFAGYPWTHLDNYVKRSPISYAGNVKTPTMVMTGEEDYRTPSSDAEQFYEALKLQKVPSVMIRIPDANHNIAAKPSNMMAKVAYILGWFERYRTPQKSAKP